MAKNVKALKADKKFNWILWSVVGVAIIAAIVGTVFIVKAVLDNNKKTEDRIEDFDSYDVLPFSYFLKDFEYIDDKTTTTTTTTEKGQVLEPVVDVADTYYLFIYDGTNILGNADSTFNEQVGEEKFIAEMKEVLDSLVAKGIKVYVADVSQEFYSGYSTATIDKAYNFTGKFLNGKTDNDGLSSISVVSPCLLKVEGNTEHKYSVTVYYSGAKELYNDIQIKLEAFEK